MRKALAETQSKLDAAEAREYEAAERAAIEADALLEAQKGGDGLYEALEWLRQDASPARYPSILRHMTEANEWRRRLHLLGHGDPDDPAFRREARKIATESGYSVREVYTLWWSP